MKMKMKATGIHILLLMALAFGCATSEKATLSSSNPQMALEEVQKLKGELRESQADIIAHESYVAGKKDLNEASELIKKGDNNEEALKLLAQAKAQFLNSQKKAKEVSSTYDRILATRMSALKANPYSNERNEETLKDIDEDLIDATDGFTEALVAQKNSQFQKRYLELEVESVQHEKLAKFRNIFLQARSNNADNLAPRTLQKAKVDILSAENAIKQSPRDPKFYQAQVLQANRSSKLLQDVMGKLLGSAKGSPEDVGLKLVYQERKLGKLSDTVGNLEQDLSQTQQSLSQTSAALGTQFKERLSAESKVRFQKAMDEFRNSFTNEEAEAYQQGDRLIFRLKKLDFAPGSSKIPESSTALLGKIESIIREVDPKDIQIQGHTDSTGSSSWNQKLSLMRAKAVEEYLNAKNDSIDTKALGYGEQKPIATNETKEGRSLNRRVDIVIDVK